MNFTPIKTSSLRPRRAVIALLALAPALAARPAIAQDAPADDVHRLDEIVVTGTRTERRLQDAPVATDVIRRAEIEASGARTAAELLSGHLGIAMSSDQFGSGVRIQGFDPEHVMILVDGKRTTGRNGGVMDLSRFSAAELERIEIVRGGSSALYGSEAMGGVVNLITRQAGKPLQVEARALAGTLGTLDAQATLGTRQERWDTLFTGRYQRRDSYDLTPERVGTTGNAYDELNLGNRADVLVSDGLALKSQLGYMLREQHGVDSNLAGAVFDRTNRTETASASLEPEWELGPESRLRVQGYYNLYRDQYLQDQRFSDALDQFQETRDQLAQVGAQHETRLGGSHLLASGAELAYEQLDTERLAAGTGNRVRGAAYVQDEWTALAAPRLIAVPGLRADGDSRYGAAVNPKLALRLDPTESLTLRASHGWGFRAPDFKELAMRFQNPSVGYEVIGNPALQPERSKSTNLGAEYRPLPWLAASLNLFHNDLTDLIQTELQAASSATALTQYTYRNVASARTMGLESALRLRPLPGLTLEPGYTLTDAVDLRTGLPLNGRARHLGNLTARYFHRPWGLTLFGRATLSGDRPYYSDRDGNTLASPLWAGAYAALDLRVTKTITEEVSAFVQGANLLDAWDATYLPIQPRTVMGGIEARF